MKQLITVKTIKTMKFGITLLEHEEDGYYQILWETEKRAGASEKMPEFTMASKLFDIKYNELKRTKTGV